jgi:hypothetical protein
MSFRFQPPFQGFPMNRLVLSAVVLFLAVVSPPLVWAQENSKLALPSDPSMWINSAPITMEALQGKAALLWFYEESCPRCREHVTLAMAAPN